MLDAVRKERRNIPWGMVSQNPMTFPNVRTPTPDSQRNAAVERAYGPAPTITTSLVALIPQASSSGEVRQENELGERRRWIVSREQTFRICAEEASGVL